MGRSISVSVVVAALTVLMALPAQAWHDFEDVASDHLFHDDVEWVGNRGITRGCNPPANTKFCPNATVTRGQMAAFLVRALELTATSTNGNFSDVPSSHTFVNDINKLATAGITKGCNPPANTKFCPSATVTRGQMAAFLRRSLSVPVRTVQTTGGMYGGWGGRYSDADRVYPHLNYSGNLALATVNGSRLVVDDYTIDDEGKVSRRRVAASISFDGWPHWGGFHAAEDGHYYLLVGRDNHDEDDSRVVVQVRRYDPSWKHVGTASLRADGEIYQPFRAAAPDMAMIGNRLIVHMGRIMYRGDDGLRHQSRYTFEVDTKTMSTAPVSSPWASHSFNQFVNTNGDDLVFVDHGDAYPRAIQLGVWQDYLADGTWPRSYEVFPINGETGDNFTGTTVTGVITQGTDTIVVGNSIDHPNAPDGPLGSNSDARNIYVTTADSSGSEDVRHRTRWLTNFRPDSDSTAMEPRLVQLSANRNAVLFTTRDASGARDKYTMHYHLLDAKGRELSSQSWQRSYFSPISDPIVKNGVMYWVGVEPSSISSYMFALDVSKPSTPQRLWR